MYYVLVEATDETLAMTRKVEIAEMVAMMSDEPCVIRKVER